MFKIKVILIVFYTFFTQSYSQCDHDECYRHYQDAIKDIKETVFDGILEKYGDVDGILKNLLDKLNKTVLTAELNLNNFQNDNTKIKKDNEVSNSTLQNLLNLTRIIEGDIINIDESKNWFNDMEDANTTASLIIPNPPTLNNIKTVEDELDKWKTFLEKFQEENYSKDIMNIPHSVSDDLDLLETLLKEEYDTSCLNEFHEDLNQLFSQLANILNIDEIKQALTKLNKRTEKAIERANDVLVKTEDVLEKEKNLQNIQDLSNGTLILAGEIEELKNNINRLMQNNEEIFDEKLKQLEKSHETDLEKLYKKYNIEEYQMLLDELDDINKQIEEIGGTNNINVADIETDIEQYLESVDYYTCILNDCRYRKPAEAVGSFNCDRKE